MKQAAVFAITGVLAGSLAGVAQQAAPQPAVPYTYQGTVHSVQAKTGTLELITGVGHALRLVQMRVPIGLQVAGTAGGASLGVRGVKPATAWPALATPRAGGSAPTRAGSRNPPP